MGIDLLRERATPRLKVFEPTAMHDHGGEAVKVHLLDLSATGALVHAAVAPPSGARVQIDCGGAMRTARVVWANGQRFGVAFTMPMTERQVEETVAHRQAEVAIAGARIGSLVR